MADEFLDRLHFRVRAIVRDVAERWGMSPRRIRRSHRAACYGAFASFEVLEQRVVLAAITISSNMNWSAISGGSGTNGAPTTADTITINSGFTLTVDVASAVSGALANNGTLAVGNGNAVALGSLASSGGVSLGNASSALTVGANNANTVYIGVISGAGTVTKVGTGTWTVSGNSTYTGATTISAGTLTLGQTGQFPNSPLGTVDGATTVASGAALNLNGKILATAERLTISGTGVSGTTGALYNGSSTPATYSGLLTLGADSTVSASSGNIILSHGGTITGSGFTLTLDGTATGSSMASVLGTGTGGLTKSGAGTWTVSGASTYTGATTISAGTLTLGANGTSPNSPLGTVAGATTVASGAALNLNGKNLATAEPITISGTGVSGTTGALYNGSSTAATYSGLLTLGANSTVKGSSGRINLSNPGIITGSGFTLTFDGDIGGSMASVLGTGTGGLTKSGTGTWTVSGASTYTGATTISAGTLRLGAAGDGTNSPLGTVAGSTSITSGASLDLYGHTLGTDESITIRGTGMSSGGALTNNNPGTTATYSGLLTLGAASTVKASSGNIILSNTGTITGATFGLTLDGTATGSSMASVLGTGTGGLTKSGTGTWTVSGASTYTGATTISAGTLLINGSLASGSAVSVNTGATLGGSGTAAGGVTANGSISPGSSYGSTDTAILNVGATTFTSGSGLKIDLNGTTAGTGHDQILSTGNISLGSSGSLSVAVATGYVPAFGSTYTILSTPSGTITGTFSGLANNAIVTANGYSFRITYNTTSVLLTAMGSTSTALQSSNISPTYGNSVTFTATMVPSDATGTVTFYDGPTMLGTGTISAGTTTYSTSALTSGSHSITAVYGGDSNYTASTSSAATQVVNTASLTITATNQTKTYGFGGSSASLGTSGFTTSGLQNGETVGAVTLSTNAASSASGNTIVGTHTLTASSGTGGTFSPSNYSISYVTGTLTVNQKALTVTGLSGTNKIYDGTTSASVIGTAGFSGLVTNDLVSLTAGTASFANATVGTGTAVTFSGYALTGDDSGNYALSQPAASTADITTASLTITATNQTKTYGFGGSSASLGTSGFTTSGLQNGETVGAVTLSTDASSSASGNYIVGTHTLTASSGTGGTFSSSNYSISYVTGTLTVNRAGSTTGLTSSANPSVYGGLVTFTATVNSDATGTVTFKDGATTLGTGIISSGAATFSTSALAGGSHSITAVYEGDGSYTGSTSTAIAQVVLVAPVVTSHPGGQTVNAGATATFAASGVGTPAPSVQWQVSTNGGSTWTKITGATSTSYTTPTTVAGNEGNLYRALFSNSQGAAVTSAAMLRVNQAPVITSQPASITTNVNSTATFTAAATGTPTPTVQWQKNTGSGWTNIDGATSVSYTTASLVSGDSGTQFRAVFTNTMGTATTNAATLTVASVANVIGTGVSWGSKTADLVVDTSDGRLLPSGRTKSIPWLNINRITLTLSQSITSLAASDVKITGVVSGRSYVVTSVTGSGTNWTISFANNSSTPSVAANGIIAADKVSFAITNSQVSTFTRRLDVLPGDVNDDGLVNSSDMVLVQQKISVPYIALYDIDGSGLVTSTDTLLVKSRLGTRLPN